MEKLGNWRFGGRIGVELFPLLPFAAHYIRLGGLDTIAELVVLLVK